MSWQARARAVAPSGNLGGLYAGQYPAQVREGIDPGVQAGAGKRQLEDGFAQSVVHRRSQIGEAAGGALLGGGMDGGGLGLTLTHHLFDAQVMPALKIAVGRPALGKAGQHFRPGLLPFRPVGRILFDLRPGSPGSVLGADTVLEGRRQQVEPEGPPALPALAGSRGVRRAGPEVVVMASSLLRIRINTGRQRSVSSLTSLTNRFSRATRSAPGQRAWVRGAPARVAYNYLITRLPDYPVTRFPGCRFFRFF